MKTFEKNQQLYYSDALNGESKCLGHLPNASALKSSPACSKSFAGFIAEWSELILDLQGGVSVSTSLGTGEVAPERETMIVDDVRQHANYFPVIAGLRGNQEA